MKKFLKKTLHWWIHWMGLGFWDLKVIFSNKKKRKKNGDLLCGRIFCDWKYLRATIIFYPKCMKGLSEEAVEKIVIHELVHILVNEMRAPGIDHEERVVTQLQKSFSWVKRGLSK